MRIFSNFDSKFKHKLIAREQETLNESEVIVITRSKFYLIFKVITPFLFIGILGGVVFLFLEKYSMNYWYIVTPLLGVWILVVWFRVIHKWLKYKYDFTVVVPKGVITYKQKGILRSYLKEIPSNRIRSIQISRNTFFGNVFGYGSVDLLTDFTDNMHIGEEDESPSVIGMTYVDAPYKVKNQITDMCFK